MDADTWGTIFTAIIASLGTFGGVWLVSKTSRRATNLDAKTKDRDNDQEDIERLTKRLDLMEKQREKFRSEANRVIDAVRVLYYQADDEVIELRRLIREGNIPVPLPDRPPREPFPVANFDVDSDTS